jgi:hypothetical protein
MASVRTVRPTDLVALAGHDGRVRPNEAVTRDRIGTQASPHPLETALEQWFSFATGRHTWISVKGARLRGLASARRRGTKTAWEMDCLIHADEDEGVLMSLLDRVVEDAGRAGAEKIFLRVPASSDVVRTACATGFFRYLSEWLMTADGPRAGAQADEDASPALRRWGRADAYATFRLYNRWTPEPVRRIEAPTFREWVASRERISPNRGARQWLVERDGDAQGWLRLAADGEMGRFELMTDASAAPELTDALIDAALSRLSEQSALLTLVPEFAAGLRERLEARGFEERAAFVVLARRTTRPVAISELASAVPAPTVPA